MVTYPYDLGFAVDAGKDVNGDGIPDLVCANPWVGAGGPSNPTAAGEVRVLSGLDGSLIHQVFGNPNDMLGSSVCLTGDLNGDGLSEFAAGAPWTAPGHVKFYDGATGIPYGLIPGAPAGSSFGSIVVDVGDVDGDGVHDQLVTDPFETTPSGSQGSMRVFSGATGAVIHAWVGLTAGPVPGGVGIAGGDDITGDGVPDVLSSAGNIPFANTNTVRVHSGADASLVYTLTGPNDTFYGTSVAVLGDVDGDGHSEFAVEARTRSYVYSGRTGTVMAVIHTPVWWNAITNGRAGDVNADGSADLMLTGVDSSATAPPAGRVSVYSIRPVPGASVASVGPGCAPAGQPVPLLSMPLAPVFGTTTTLALGGAPPNTQGWLFASPLPPAPLDLGSGCVVYLDPGAAVPLATFATLPAGVWSMPIAPGTVPALAGHRLRLQAALFPGAGQLLLTNGLEVQLGY